MSDSVTLPSIKVPSSDEEPTLIDVPIVVVAAWHRRVWRFLKKLPAAVKMLWRETELE